MSRRVSPRNLLECRRNHLLGTRRVTYGFRCDLRRGLEGSRATAISLQEPWGRRASWLVIDGLVVDGLVVLCCGIVLRPALWLSPICPSSPLPGSIIHRQRLPVCSPIPFRCARSRHVARARSSIIRHQEDRLWPSLACPLYRVSFSLGSRVSRVSRLWRLSCLSRVLSPAMLSRARASYYFPFKRDSHLTNLLF